MPTGPESLWNRLALDDTVELDLAETITPRAGGLVPPASGAGTLPSLPLISLAIPGALGASAAGATHRASAKADLDVTGVLGEGGMGRVLLARQRSLQRDVAVKVLNEGVEDPDALGGLLSEAVITGSLEHPNIVPVHALGCDDGGRPVLVMKRIDGVSWRELARDAMHPAWASLDVAGDERLRGHLEIFMQVCSALHFAHRRGVVHRDIKPANVMIGSYGEVYVVDWGIATRVVEAPGEGGTSPVVLVGTPAYMPPEMVWGEAHRVDARTDVYLLGAALHNVLTGKPRHRGETLFETLFTARASAPYAYGPEVPAELSAICNKATSVDPGDRYPSALALRHAVGEYLRHQGSVALGDVAAAQLAELRAALAARDTAGAVVDPRRLHRLMTECRFGFMQALRSWKDNVAARAGLAACLAVMIEHELAERDREVAAALIAELPEPRPDLERRLADLDAELGVERERAERLRKMEQEHDPSVGARSRFLLSAVIAALAISVAAVVEWMGPERIGHAHLVGFMAVVTAVLVPVIFVARARLFATQAGRVAAGATLVWAVGTLGHRLLAARFGVSVERTLVLELGQTTTLLAATSITLPRGFWWSAAVGAAAVIAGAARPDLALSIYTATGVLVCGILMFVGYRMVR